MTDQTIERADAAPTEAKPGPSDRPLPGGRTDTYRHPPLVRISHWLNVTAVVVLIMSGLNILLAHPHLDWGTQTNFGNHWLNIPPIPNWLLIPQGRNLAEARHWHFFFAWVFVINGLIYLAYGFLSKRFGRRLWPTRLDLAGFWPSVKEHARFHFPRDDKARTYNVIQKLTYVVMLLVILPMMLITGLSITSSTLVNAPLGNWLTGTLFIFRSSALIVTPIDSGLTATTRSFVVTASALTGSRLATNW